MYKQLSRTEIFRALKFIALTIFIAVVIELAHRAGIKLPAPFFFLLLSVVASGWYAGTLGGAVSGFIAALYIIYLSLFDLLPKVLPEWNQAVLLAAVLFSGSGLLSAYFKSQKLQILRAALKHKAQLRQKECVYQTLAEASQDAIARFDGNFRYVYVNHLTSNLSGKEPEEYLGKTVADIGLSNKLSQDWEKSIERVFQTGQPDAIFYETTDMEGGHSIIDCRFFPEFNRAGTVESVVQVSRDVTERRAFEKEKQELKRLETLGVLAAGIAHDFNNILTVVFGNISLLKDTLPAGHSGYEYINNAEEAFERASHLTKQVLNFSKGGEPDKERLRLDELIKNVVTFDLSGSNVSLIFEANENLWPIEVDRAQMEQVFSNLAINARQAMPDGGHITIRMTNVDFQKRKLGGELRQQRYIKITIRDEGTGIKKQYLANIFDPYFSTKARGNGLGLATVYSNIIKHEGHIGVKSKPGEGTNFTIYLPAPESVQNQEPVRGTVPSPMHKIYSETT